jgi:hypothetical protein
MKIVLKKDFVMSLNLRKFELKRGDIIEADKGMIDVLDANGGAYDIVESDDVLTEKELEEVIVIDDEQTEEEAIDAEIERSIVEDEQTEIEALEAEEVRAEIEDVKPKRKSKRTK